MISERNRREGERSSTDSKNNSRRGGRGNDRHQQDERPQYTERVAAINRVPKAVRGNRRSSFTALVTVGDGEGTVGVGYGKTKEVPAAIQKDAEEARKNFSRIPMIADTITHPVQSETAADIVLLRPAAPNTGLIAGGAVHPVLECAGIQDVLSKSLGTNNSINVVHATVDALKQLVHPEEVAARRDKSLEEVAPACMLRARAGQGA